MKLRLLLSALIILFVGITAFAATKSALSAQVTLAANTFSTGTVGLQISKSTNSNPTSGSFTDTSIAGFTGNVLPGQTASQTFWLKNNSTNVDLAIAAQASSVSGEISPVDVTVAFTPVSNDATSNTGSQVSHTLLEWESIAALNTTLLHNVNSGRQRYKMDVTLSSSVSTAGSINFDFVFTGTQTP